jgi:nitrate reductase gamma subunit
MSDLLYFAEHRLQEGALIIMALVYTLRLIWLARFTASKERQAATGMGDTSPRKGFLYSWANIAQPWAMESTRTKLFLYGQFVFFHIGVVAAIALSFVIPYGEGLLKSNVVQIVLQVLIGAACVVGVLRIIRRVGNVYMRAISSPDDYFSLLFLTVWFAFAFLSVPNNYQSGEMILLVYFFQTAFFLIYVPFSKISHYLYYPFTRYYLGKSLGRRGVFPVRRVSP